MRDLHEQNDRLLPQCVHDFAKRHSLPAESFRGDGRLLVSIDGLFRVMILATASGAAALEHDLLTLAGLDSGKEASMLHQLSKVACGMLKDHDSTLAIDPQRNVLVLQQLMGVESDVNDLERAIGRFANAVEFWRTACLPYVNEHAR